MMNSYVHLIIFQSVVSLGLGATGAIGSAVQAGQLTSLGNKVDEKASATDLTSAVGRISSLETATTTTSVSNICTNVSL